MLDDNGDVELLSPSRQASKKSARTPYATPASLGSFSLEDLESNAVPAPPGIADITELRVDTITNLVAEAKALAVAGAYVESIRKYEYALWGGYRLRGRLTSDKEHAVQEALLAAFRGCGGALLKLGQPMSGEGRAAVEERALQYYFAAVKVARTVYGPADPRGVAAEMLTRFENEDARRMVLEAGEVEFPSKIGDSFS
jgi:hypothetical protein